MEISPISAIRLAPMMRSKQTDRGLPEVFEIESSARSGDETYSSDGNGTPSGFEDEQDAETGEELDSETAVEQRAEKAPDDGGEISFFA